MSYKALLFCPDEKTARTVTQVLSELEFQVEPCNEPFAAVKKLTAEHFDAIVVDCENEQNAILLFKSARNSASSQASLSIAVVEGQAGVAKAFRIGANLVLTKPINIEQSKGTIRVARGLLRKSESAKAAATSTEHSAQHSGTNVLNEVPAPAPSSVFELEQEPEAKPEPTEAALLESMPDPSADLGRAAAAGSLKGSSWQPISKPMAAALQSAAEATGHSGSSVSADSATTPAFGSASGTGAAAAPAKQKPPVTEEITPEETESPTSATSIAQPRSVRSASAGGSRKAILIAAVVLLAAAAGYMSWQKTHYHLNFVRKTAAPARPVHQPQPATPPVASPAANPAPTAAAATTPAQFDAEVIAAPLPSIPEQAAASNEPPAPKPKKTTAPVASSGGDAPAHKKNTVAEASAPSAIVVTGGRQKAVEQPMISEVPAEAAPGALDIAQNSNDNAISGLVNVPTDVPHAAPQTLKVSQGVSQGLLVKKVAPVYPEQALQMKIQGPVQIMATINKDGNITNLKLVSGDPILARAAMDAVKQWKYQPYYLDSQPVDIQTDITVNFKLP
ncbi:MAG TPA: TonB family protein [Terriglobales bacterium]|nr:TonB family protein [Terriglobales bacterium]